MDQQPNAISRPPARPPQAREKLLGAAIDLVRHHGFAATSVEALCAAVGVTKGAFFHHFPSKEALGEAACHHWSAITGALFAGAPYHAPADPFDRIIAYLDFRAGLIRGEPAAFTCLAGTMLQECHETAPLRNAAYASIQGHAATLVEDFRLALDAAGLDDPDADSLALLTQTVLQGAFIVAKGQGSGAIAIDSIAHLKRYFRLLFNRSEELTS